MLAADQDTLDALFGISPEERRELREGTDSAFVGRLRKSDVAAQPDFRKAAVIFSVVVFGALLGVGFRGKLALAFVSVGLLLGVALAAHELFKRRKAARAVPKRILVVEGSATTRRYWFPSYGEVSRLCADVLLGEERYVLPAQFDDHAVVGPVRIFAIEAEPKVAPGAARGLVVALELLPGAELTRRAPTKQPPTDFLRIEEAD